jgi:hypothetical protein
MYLSGLTSGEYAFPKIYSSLWSNYGRSVLICGPWFSLKRLYH